MPNGLTPTGFTAPTVQEIVNQISTALLTNVSATLDTAPDQPIGQIVGIMAEKFAEIWEFSQTVYNQTDPDAAEGYLLDALCALTGTRRRSATYSTVTANLTLNGSTTVTAGSVASVAGQPSNTWVLEANVVNSGGSPGTFSGVFRSSLPGPFVANAGTLTVISTPVAGWTAVTNPADAIEGIPEDTDAVLRVRRQQELSAAGSCTVDAIRADLLAVEGVLQAFVLENSTDATDANGIPPHSFEAIVWDGPGLDAADNAIAQAIWNDKPTGIKSYGPLSGTAIDSTGQPHTVPFARATQIPIYLDITITVDGTYPPGGDTLVKAALAAFALANWNLGVSVIAERLKAVAFTVQGVVDVGTLLLDVHASPSGLTNITISQLQIATLSTVNIAVHST